MEFFSLRVRNTPNWLHIVRRTAVGLAVGAVGLLAVVGGAVIGWDMASSRGTIAALIGAIRPSGEELVGEAAPAELISGNTTELRWTHREKSADGSYVLTYACVTGLELAVVNRGDIGCDTPYPLASAMSVLVRATSTLASPANVAVSIGFVPNGAFAPI